MIHKGLQSQGQRHHVKSGGGSVFMKFTIYIHSEILHSSFDPLTTKFWGGHLLFAATWLVHRPVGLRMRDMLNSVSDNQPENLCTHYVTREFVI